MELKNAPQAIAAGLGLALIGSAGCTRAVASEPKQPAAPVSLTVYKQDFGTVHERRAVELNTGSNDVHISNVSQQLDPDSVMFDPPKGSRVVSTTYELGAGSNSTLIQRLAGKEVEFIWDSNDGKEGDKMRGILEPTSDGGFLLRVGDKVYINPKGTLVAPSDVSTLPGLTAKIESDGAAKQDLAVSYLTRGLSWNADYVAHLDADNRTLALECWASVQNSTGIAFRDASITFVAGSPNRAVTEARARKAKLENQYEEDATLSAPAAGASANVRPQAVGELYQYKPKDRANVGTDQINRVRMFDAPAVPVKLDYSVRLPDIYGWWSKPGQRQNAQLAINLLNSEKNGLGLPMPSGAVRIYQSDDSEKRYTGADTLQDLPVDSRASLTLTNVFDVTAEPMVASSVRLNKRTLRKTLRVNLRNAKAKDVELRLVQNIYGKYSIFEGTKPQKLDASTLQWKVTVPTKGEKTFEVKVDVEG